MYYEPFPIYDMRTGKVTSRDPWLLPFDAFAELHNCHLLRGILEKRRGYTEFGKIVHTNTSTGASTYPGSEVVGLSNYASGGTLTLLAMDVDRINKYSGTAFVDLTRNKIHVKHGGVQNHAPIADDIIEGATSGAYATVESVVTDHGAFADGDADGTIILKNATKTGTFQSGEQLRDKGTPANVFGVADGAASDQEFTGDASDFFVAENWEDVIYMVNGQDQIQKYDGTSLSRYYIDLDVEGGPDNDVDTCKIVFLYNSRLLLLNVTERGTNYPRRARWGEVNDSGTWKDDNYRDAPTSGVIVFAGFIGTDLIVFFNNPFSVYKLTYTGDYDVPFRWDPIDSEKGSGSPRGFICGKNRIIAVGQTNILVTDGRSVEEIDYKIQPDVSHWNMNALEYCYGLKVEQQRQYWLSYPSQNSSYCDSVLIFNYDDESFSDIELPVHCLGETILSSSLVLDDIETTLDDIHYSFDDVSLQAGYPLLLMGTRTGYVYRLNNEFSDDSSNVEFYALSGRWNPFIKEGVRAWLGWVEFLVSMDENITLNVEFYKDTDQSYYTSESFTCEGTMQDDEKVWKKIIVGEQGTYHRIRIGNASSVGQPKIHAIVPYFKRGGKLF